MLRRSRSRRGRAPSATLTAIVWRGKSLPHARQDRQASSVSRPLEGRQRPKKPGPSLLQVASPVWRGTPVRLRLPVFARAVDWPLVQIPADRHTTTGTCVLGKMVICANRLQTQAVFSLAALFSVASQKFHKRPAAGGAKLARADGGFAPTLVAASATGRAIDDRRPVRRARDEKQNEVAKLFRHLAEYLASAKCNFMLDRVVHDLLWR